MGRARFLSMLLLVTLLLDDFLGVRDVSWVSHQLIDGFQRLAGRIYRGSNFPNPASALRKFRATPTAQRDTRTFRGRRRLAEWTPNINKRRSTGCGKAS